MHRVVIIGGGFGGLYAARCLRKAAVDVTLVDRRNYHLFQPLLYQVATGTLSPANIAAPLRGLLRRQANTRVLLAEARDIDVAGRRVVLDEGAVEYDTLIVAAGSSHSYFGHDEWAALAPSLKSLDDATDIRRRILMAFEAAERATDADEIRALLTFVIVGAGPTGVELAGQVAEISQHTLRGEFRAIQPSVARIYLVEAADRPLPPYPPQLSAKAAEALREMGVQLITKAEVTDITPGGVAYGRGGDAEFIAARTVLWAAGVQASPLTRQLAEASGAKLDRQRRVTVQPDLSLPGHPEVLVIGDMAHYEQNGQPLPALAPVAMQQGSHVARLIVARLSGGQIAAFKYRDRGTMATIGRNQAVVDMRYLKAWGPLAWLMWLFIHLLLLVQFQSRVLVLMQWAWAYFTRQRSARLITGGIRLPQFTTHHDRASTSADDRAATPPDRTDKRS